MSILNVNKINPVGGGSTITIAGIASVTSNVSVSGSIVAGTTITGEHHGDGSNLTSLPAQVTISNNADNRVITGGSGVNLNGESGFTFNGTVVQVPDQILLNTAGSSIKSNQLRFQAGAAYIDNYSNGQDINFRTSVSSALDTTGPIVKSNGNLAFASGKGIDFSATGDGSGTDSSELLDDYEEGTWTPDVRGSSSAGSATYTSRSGNYVKIGRLVMVWSDVRWSSHNGSGGLEVYGLPYSVNNGGYTSHFGVNYNSGMSYATDVHYGWANNGGSHIRYWETNSSGGNGSLALDSSVSEVHFYGQYFAA